MANKASRLSGYNLGFTNQSGNSAEVKEMDAGDVLFTNLNPLGGGSGGNDPYIKQYSNVPNAGVLTPAFQTLPSAPPTGLACSAYGWVNGAPIWVALTNSTTITAGALMTSPDGKNWTARTLNTTPGGAWKAIAFGNGRFVAVAASAVTTTGIATSVDGVNWVFTTTPAPGAAWANVVFGGAPGQGHFVAIANFNGTANTVHTSVDGKTWTAQTTPTSSGNWTSCAWGNPLGTATGLWVFTAANVTTATAAYTSVPVAMTASSGVTEGVVALGTFAAITLPLAPVTGGLGSVAFHPNTYTSHRPHVAVVGSIANGTTLTLASPSNKLLPGMVLSAGTGATPGTTIISGSGSVYTVATPYLPVTGSSISGTTLTLGTSTTLGNGAGIFGTGASTTITAATTVASGGTGTSFTVNNSQTWPTSGTGTILIMQNTVASTTLRFDTEFAASAVPYTGVFAMLANSATNTQTITTSATSTIVPNTINGQGGGLINIGTTNTSIAEGQTVSGTGVTAGTLVNGFAVLTVNLTITSGSTAATLATSNTNIFTGQSVTGAGIASGTTVTVSGTSVTLSAAATASGTISANFTGGLFFVNISQTVTSTTLTYKYPYGVAYNYDGANVNNVAVPTQAPGAAWLKMVYGQGYLWAINASTAAGDAIMYSRDAQSWQFLTLPAALATGERAAWTNIAVGDFLSGLVVITSNSATTGLSLASGIAGIALLAEIPNSGTQEGFPDLFIVSNQPGFAPDASSPY